jgi:hypothetical protein
VRDAKGSREAGGRAGRMRPLTIASVACGACETRAKSFQSLGSVSGQPGEIGEQGRIRDGQRPSHELRLKPGNPGSGGHAGVNSSIDQRALIER